MTRVFVAQHRRPVVMAHRPGRLVGVVGGVLLAVLADLPMALLTAMAGATAVVVGVMLLVGTVSIGDFGSVATTASLDDRWWWYAAYVGLAIAGIPAQLTATARLRGAACVMDRVGRSSDACRVSAAPARVVLGAPVSPPPGLTPSLRARDQLALASVAAPPRDG